MPKFVPVKMEGMHPRAEELRQFLSKRLIGQERAIDRLVTSFNLHLSPLNDGQTPIFCGLLMGDTGSGKTLTAELLAEFFCGDRQALTKVMGPEFSESHLITELTGSSHSYVGYDDPPRFSQQKIDGPALKNRFRVAYLKSSRVRELAKDILGIQDTIKTMRADDPNRKDLIIQHNQLQASLQIQLEKIFEGEPIYSVVLLDEIEKASHALFNLLLEISSKGQISIKGGSEVAGTTSFHNSFILLTSNIASDKFEKMALGGVTQIGFGNGSSDKSNAEWHVALQELKKVFPPELLNRLEDNTIVYHRLSPEQLVQVLEIELAEVANSLWTSHRITLLISKKFKNFVTESILRRQEYGGRQARKRVKKYLREILAAPLASGEIIRGDSVYVSINNNGKIQVFRDESKIIIPENKLGEDNGPFDLPKDDLPTGAEKLFDL